MLEPGEFQGHQLMGPDLPGTSQPGNHPEFTECSINQAAGVILGLTEVTLLSALGSGWKWGQGRKDLRHHSPLASQCMAAVDMAFTTLSMMGTGDQLLGTLRKRAFLG